MSIYEEREIQQLEAATVNFGRGKLMPVFLGLNRYFFYVFINFVHSIMEEAKCEQNICDYIVILKYSSKRIGFLTVGNLLEFGEGQF
ncbi:MAG: hypothetical protein HUJ74_02705 [Lachnospiraceae bacterium]|nr:hypothetical protein [Lachnospiraceae bacterium]